MSDSTYITKVMQLLNKELVSIVSNDPDFYGKYNIVLANEQQYVSNANRDPNNIYVVVKMLQATINFGCVILPITINAVAEQNKIEACQRLLLEFAQTYNLTDSADGTIKQTYTTPVNGGNFNEMFEGFRSLFFMSGTYLISDDANPFTLSYKESESAETSVGIDMITGGVTFDVQHDSQANYSSGDLTESRAMIGTFSLSFVSYLTDKTIYNTCLNIGAGIEKSFYFTLTFKNGTTISKTLKLVNLSIQQNVGDIPVVSMTFTM